MKRILLLATLLLFSVFSIAVEDRVELDTTIIKGNTELPKILYVVPWADLDGKVENQQKIKLHSLFGDMFDPVTPLSPEQLKRARQTKSGD